MLHLYDAVISNLSIAGDITIHKYQSLTLECVVVDFKIICASLQFGQIYVALSRVQSFEYRSILKFEHKQFDPRSLWKINQISNNLRNIFPNGFLRTGSISSISNVFKK